jgi:hypothetical protein
MTAIAPPEAQPVPVVTTPMLGFLVGMHDQWRREVGDVLEPASGEGAGIWLRWRAIEYLETGFRRRFQREQEAVGCLQYRLPDDQQRHLWTTGELLTQLLGSLGSRVGLCQRSEQFSMVALTIMTALEYWCRQVEESLGQVRWGDVPAECRRRFELITYDELTQGV